MRPNPVLFALPNDVDRSSHQENTGSTATSSDNSKENDNKKSNSDSNPVHAPEQQHSQLPYRSIFAVLTWDSVLVYDSLHSQPLAVARGLHYAHLVDAAWTSDGHTLTVCSTDGYISILSFGEGELGHVYEAPLESNTSIEHPSLPIACCVPDSKASTSPPTLSLVAPCEPGTAFIVEPPSKRTKTAPEGIVDGLGSADDLDVDVHVVAHRKKHAADCVGAVDKLSLETMTTQHACYSVVDCPVPAKKKKRIQPTLLA